MKKQRTILLSLLMVFALLIGGTASAAEAPTGDPIKIGYINPLTGDTALWGQTGLNGMILAAEKINAAGGVLGRPIEIVGLDNRDQTPDSIIAFNKLVDEHGVVAVVGTNTSNHNIAMAPIANQRQIPLIGTATTNELVTVDENGNLHPYSFRMCFLDSFQGAKMAEYALANGLTKGAIITNLADSYATGITKYATEAFVAGGGTMVAQENSNEGDTDYRAQLSSIAEANPDVLFIPENYAQVAFIARQARELGMECAFYGFDGWDSVELPAMADGALEGGRYASRPGFSLPEAQEFGVEYQARFDNAVLEAESLFTSDAVNWIVQCIEAAGSADPIAIRDQLENTTSFVGLMGEMSNDPATHNPNRELAIFEIQGTQNVLIEIIK